MAQGRSTKIISMIKWIRTSRLAMKISLSLSRFTALNLWRLLKFGKTRLSGGGVELAPSTGPRPPISHWVILPKGRTYSGAQR